VLTISQLARRILRRLEHNGWTGWTNTRRISTRT
jgi:hypothetical protein